jgi:predicted porin
MNKKLLAVAVVGALASPAAFAQGSTMYGIFDLGFQHASDYSGRNKNFIQEGMRDPSRFGVRGSEDLEGGMYAMYGFEFNMPIDTGAEPTLTRLAFVGLGSKAWGELTLGRQYTHLFHTYAVGSAHAYGTFASSFGQTPTTVRVSNGVKYSSPVFNGFSVGAIWSPSGQVQPVAGAGGGEPTDLNTTQNYYDAVIRWTPGPFGVAGGIGKNKTDVSGTGSTDTTYQELSANWDNKAFGVYGNYMKQKTDTPTVSNATDWKTYSISGVARFGGRHEVYAMYSKAKNDGTGAVDAEATSYGIVYENVMSKRTRLYVGYGKTTNKDGMNLAPTSYAVATPGPEFTSPAGATASNALNPLGKDPSAFQVGISHSF